jgi:hypothetical protein
MHRNRTLTGDRFVVAGCALAFEITTIGGLTDQEIDTVDATVLFAALVSRFDFVV